jgi:hypothetical protein
MSESIALWALALVPALPLFFIYLAFRSVLDSKKFEMEMLLDRGETLTNYLAAYGGSEDSTEHKSAERQEDQIERIVGQVFRLHYPTAEYALALTLSTIVIALLVILGFSLAGLPLGLPANLKDALAGNANVRNIVSGGVGALVWSIYELVERYRSRDLPADGFFAPGIRIVVVGAVAAVISPVVNEHLAVSVAFAIGALPLSAVLDFVSRRARKQLGLPEPVTIEPIPSFNILQGWNADISQRLARSGVSSVQALACANQFELYLRSSLEWRIILDLSDQALLVLYVGDRIEKLRSTGIRTAVELAELDWSEGEEYFNGIDRDSLIDAIGTALNLGPLEVRHLIRSVSNDATVDFLASLWSDDTPTMETLLSPIPENEQGIRLQEKMDAVQTPPVANEQSSAQDGESSRTQQPSSPRGLTSEVSSELRDRLLQSERLALRKVETEKNLPLQKQVAFGTGQLLAFDGVADTPSEFIAVDVKYLREPWVSARTVNDMLQRSLAAEAFLRRSGDKRALRLLMVFVIGKDTGGGKARLTRLLESRLKDAPVAVDYEVYFFDELQREASSVEERHEPQ